MSVLLAVAAVGLGSLALRLVPLLGAERLPDRLARTATWAGVSVLAAITVRSVVTHEDAALPADVPAPLVAAVAVGLGLWVAARGRPVLISVATGAAAYLVLAGVLAGVEGLDLAPGAVF
jgi:branched-subunit amino acid transport protein